MKNLKTIAQLALGTSIAILVAVLFCLPWLIEDDTLHNGSRQGRLYMRAESTGRQ